MKTYTILICIVLSFTTASLSAQFNFTEGYVITWHNDTIHGKIREISIIFKGVFVELKDKQSTIINFTPKDIKKYSKSGIIDYMLIEIGWNKEFARVIKDGEIKLLLIKTPRTNTQAEEFDPKHFGNDYYYDQYYLYNTANSRLTTVYKGEFRNDMADYFGDDPELSEMILNEELSYPELEIIVEKYNNWKRNQAAP